MIGVGDLVVCVDAAPRNGEAETPLREDAIYTVTRVAPDGCGINLAEVCPSHGCFDFWSDRFRKIQHDKREACESEFVTLLKRKSVKQGEKA